MDNPNILRDFLNCVFDSESQDHGKFCKSSDIEHIYKASLCYVSVTSAFLDLLTKEKPLSTGYKYAFVLYPEAVWSDLLPF